MMNVRSSGDGSNHANSGLRACANNYYTRRFGSKLDLWATYRHAPVTDPMWVIFERQRKRTKMYASISGRNSICGLHTASNRPNVGHIRTARKRTKMYASVSGRNSICGLHTASNRPNVGHIRTARKRTKMYASVSWCFKTVGPGCWFCLEGACTVMTMLKTVSG